MPDIRIPQTGHDIPATEISSHDKVKYYQVGSFAVGNRLVPEARRCMSCGNCFGCDNCFGVCPDNAIIKIEPGKYEFKYDYCKGCGVCAAECPCGAIDMIPEEI